MNFRVQCESPSAGVLNIVASDSPGDVSTLSRELLEADLARLRGTVAVASIAASVSCAQTLFRHGGQEDARTFIGEFLRRFHNQYVFMLQDVGLAQGRLLAEQERASTLVKNMALGGLEYLTYFKGRYCNHPFDDFEIRSDGEVFVCCPTFLPWSIGNAYQVKSPSDLKSGKRFLQIKRSIEQQDFRYCRWMHCGKILRNQLDEVSQLQKSEYAPVDFRLSYDPTCNLWCPSCRTEKIVAKGKQRERILALTDDLVLPMLKAGQSCMMNGYGDVFASRACRRILEAANRGQFSMLRFDFITNGVLFTRSEWEKFPNIHDMVRSVRVSIDAAQKPTYDKNRLGGNWTVLLDNLEFIASLRREGVIESFMISMVVQDNNFREMTDFALMAKRLGCDNVIFEPIINWNTYSLDVFQRKSVHDGAHPDHAAFRDELERMYKVLGGENEATRGHAGSYPTRASVNF